MHRLEMDMTALASRLSAAEAKAKQAPTKTATSESAIEKALEPMKQLWKMGFLSPEEILKKIFKE
jgi:hypothetical protein